MRNIIIANAMQCLRDKYNSKTISVDVRYKGERRFQGKWVHSFCVISTSRLTKNTAESEVVDTGGQFKLITQHGSLAV